MPQLELKVTAPPVLVREQAFERLRDAIIRGHFAPGQRLIERELCEATGVSRASIREVIRGLEAERLVVVEPRRGPVVARLTRKQAVEIYDIRAQLEALLVRRFTETADDADIVKIRRIFKDVERAAKAKDVSGLVEIMRRFIKHMLVVIDNEIIEEILHRLLARISVLRVMAMSHPGRIQTSVGEIRAIVEAIEARDADAAASNVIAYISNARDAALAQIAALNGEKST